MNNLFDTGVKDQILARIGYLHHDTRPKWGKMNVAQMLIHCCRPLELVMGEVKLQPVGFLMKLLGIFIKKQLVSSKPYKPNLRTAPGFVTLGNEYEFEESRSKLIETVKRFVQQQDRVQDFDHPLFGKLTKEEWGRSQYKHLDHHLGQFGV